MKLIIAGGRGYLLRQVHFEWLNQIPDVTEVVSGGAPGADKGGEFWARLNRIPVKSFPADWETHGKAAGPIRNAQMAEYADALALFPGGRGSCSMLRSARRQGLTVYIFEESND